MDNFSIADVMALAKNENTAGFGNGWLFIILLVLLFGGANGFNNGGTSNTDRDVLQQSNNIQRDILESTNVLGGAIKDSQYATLMGFKDTQAQMASCCCELKTTMHAEGEATRALITQNRMADLERELSQANTAVANAVQTQNILNALGRYIPYNTTNNNGTNII